MSFEYSCSRARSFIAEDVNDLTRSAAAAALAAAEAAPHSDAAIALADTFCEDLAFGTAGLRAEMGAGWARMNDLTVAAAAQGLLVALEEIAAAAMTDAPEAAVVAIRQRGLVVGADHRAAPELGLSSLRFAAIVAAACVARGFRVRLLAGAVPTPLLAYAVRARKCAAGVMVTASHNPARDNGLKVYGADGVQISSPFDSRVAQAMARERTPWPAARTAYVGSDASALRASAPDLVADDDTEALAAEYVEAVAADQSAARHASGAALPPSPLRVAYTAMHGVGTPFLLRMFAAFSLPAPSLTAAQCSADAKFPTVKYPNPEERGALALGCAAADDAGATLLLANDPDADRMAAAERGADGRWRVFTGNELGAILGAYCLDRWRASKPPSGAPVPLLLASAVSSKQLRALAACSGAAFEETLTGFKWIGRAMAAAPAAGRRAIFAFEEAIGFACGDVVRDKDGLGAAAVLADVAHAAARSGRTLVDVLASVHARTGWHVTRAGYFRLPRPTVSAAVFAHLRADGHYWARLANGLVISRTRDLSTPGWDSAAPGGAPALPTSANGNMITYAFANGVELTLRSSGTEPKLKYYAEAVVSSGAGGGGDEGAARAAAVLLEETLAVALREMVQPEAHGLSSVV